jgi:hypothetical protein
LTPVFSQRSQWWFKNYKWKRRPSGELINRLRREKATVKKIHPRMLHCKMRPRDQEIANQKPLLIIVEDLHKVDGAAISYLITLHRILQYSSQGNIFFLWTSRWEQEKSPEAEIFCKSNKNDDNDKDNSWDDWFWQLMDSKGDNQLQIILKSFCKPEACQVLQESINGLNDKEAEWIVDHVGRSPYALKEGLLFLESKDIIQRRRDEGGFRRCFSEELWKFKGQARFFLMRDQDGQAERFFS